MTDPTTDPPARSSADPSAHPRPQFRRETWTDLCGVWRFAFDDGDAGLGERWFEPASAEVFDRAIRVPYPPESKLSEVHDPGFHPVVWYERTFTADLPTDGNRVLLHFGAVDYSTTVWVNGLRVGGHEGGHTPFTFDITEALREGGEQTVVVRAEDQPTDASQPRGKQCRSLGPEGIFYDRTTGIWQPVWLETVSALHVADLAWATDLEAGTVQLELTLSRTPVSPVELDVRLDLAGDLLARQTVRVGEQTSRVVLTVPDLLGGRAGRLLWSPESPILVDATLALRGGDRHGQRDGRDQPGDEVSSYLGLRSVGFRDGLFLLNGRPYYLRMVLEQGFWPQSHLAAPDADALRREVELIKELGFTGARIHQKIEDPRFLYWCDRLGLLVWGEMANAFEFSTRAVDRLTREWTEVVRRDRSHPCVVCWVPLNESWGVPHIATSAQQRSFATALYHLTRAIDPTRPVISNDGWEHTDSDIWGVHDYTPRGASIDERYGSPESLDRTLYGPGPGRRKVLLTDPVREGQPVVLTEFGGLSYLPEGEDKWFGYSTVDSPEALRDRFGELVGAILDSPELAGFCYTQLTDTQQERNGLLTEDRTPKLPVEQVREIVSGPSRAIPAEEIDAYRLAARQAQRRRPGRSGKEAAR
ncbi:sugar-binding domain-containing protein [Actinopolymorpha sp. NPDC004070]|uniref:glycoside hydrolase family 2 protein n=1 Tax=Actinopolymorpha sp. NPDC004070 TaxID=3154548 RepID=UPI0033A433DB